MNAEQVKSLLRTLLSTFGGLIGGWFAAKGWFTIDQVTSVINSPTTLALITSAVMAIWGLFTHTQANAVAVVGTIAEDPKSAVKGVVMTDTTEGRAIADAAPATVVAAGTPAAATLAKPSA